MFIVHIILKNKLRDGEYQDVEICNVHSVKIEGSWVYVYGELNSDEIVVNLLGMFMLPDIVGWYMEYD